MGRFPRPVKAAFRPYGVGWHKGRRRYVAGVGAAIRLPVAKGWCDGRGVGVANVSHINESWSMNATRLSRFVLLVAVVVSLSSAFGASWKKGGSGNGVSLDQAVEGVKRRTGARVLNADTVSRDGGRVHSLRILTPQGRVKRMEIDGSTGQPVAPRRRR